VSIAGHQEDFMNFKKPQKYFSPISSKRLNKSLFESETMPLLNVVI
jgi:hypothetical protein